MTSNNGWVDKEATGRLTRLPRIKQQHNAVSDNNGLSCDESVHKVTMYAVDTVTLNLHKPVRRTILHNVKISV